MGNIFKEFVKYVNKKIAEDPAYPEDAKEYIAAHVYHYIMRLLHPRY